MILTMCTSIELERKAITSNRFIYLKINSFFKCMSSFSFYFGYFFTNLKYLINLEKKTKIQNSISPKRLVYVVSDFTSSTTVNKSTCPFT